MPLKIQLLTFFFLSYFNIYCVALKNVLCEQKTRCLCNYYNGDSIDLSRFTNLFASNSTVAYMYEPCNDELMFKESVANAVLWKYTVRYPTNAALTYDEVMQDLENPNITRGTLVVVGVGDSAMFIDTERLINAAKITYSYKDRQSVVHLVCNVNAKTTLTIGEVKYPYRNALILTSPDICPRVPGPVPVPAQGLSIAASVLIFLLVCFASYCIFGILYQKFRRGAEGVEVIPNYQFWGRLFTNIENGFRFIFRGCKRAPTGPYNNI